MNRTPHPTRHGYVLTPEAQEWHDAFDSDWSCTCHLSPPCGRCTDIGNMNNLAQDEDAWEKDPAPGVGAWPFPTGASASKIAVATTAEEGVMVMRIDHEGTSLVDAPTSKLSGSPLPGRITAGRQDLELGGWSPELQAQLEKLVRQREAVMSTYRDALVDALVELAGGTSRALVDKAITLAPKLRAALKPFSGEE